MLATLILLTCNTGMYVLIHAVRGVLCSFSWQLSSVWLGISSSILSCDFHRLPKTLNQDENRKLVRELGEVGGRDLLVMSEKLSRGNKNRVTWHRTGRPKSFAITWNKFVTTYTQDILQTRRPWASEFLRTIILVSSCVTPLSSPVSSLYEHVDTMAVGFNM